MKTLPIFSVESRSSSDGSLSMQLVALDGTLYLGAIVTAFPIGGWNARLIANGEIIHMSEHGSRNDGELELAAALKRAIDLREGP